MSKPLYITMGMIGGMVKWVYLNTVNLNISELQKVASALIVAACCGAASAAGGMVIKWVVRYSREFLRTKKIIK